MGTTLFSTVKYTFFTKKTKSRISSVMCRQTGNREMSNRTGENGAEITKGDGGRKREGEIHRCTYFYVIAVEAMHCCRETKANVAEKLRGKDEVRGFRGVRDECRRVEKRVGENEEGEEETEEARETEYRMG